MCEQCDTFWHTLPFHLPPLPLFFFSALLRMTIITPSSVNYGQLIESLVVPSIAVDSHGHRDHCGLLLLHLSLLSSLFSFTDSRCHRCSNCILSEAYTIPSHLIHRIRCIDHHSHLMMKQHNVDQFDETFVTCAPCLWVTESSVFHVNQ